MAGSVWRALAPSLGRSRPLAWPKGWQKAWGAAAGRLARGKAIGWKGLNHFLSIWKEVDPSRRCLVDQASKLFGTRFHRAYRTVGRWTGRRCLLHRHTGRPPPLPTSNYMQALVSGNWIACKTGALICFRLMSHTLGKVAFCESPSGNPNAMKPSLSCSSSPRVLRHAVLLGGSDE